MKPNSVCTHENLTRHFERMLAVANDCLARFSEDLLGDHPASTLEWADIQFQRAVEKRFARNILKLLAETSGSDGDELAREFVMEQADIVLRNAGHLVKSTSLCANLLNQTELEVRAKFVRDFTTLN